MSAPREQDAFLLTMKQSMEGMLPVVSQLVQALSTLQGAFDKLGSQQPIKALQSVPAGAVQTASATDPFGSFRAIYSKADPNVQFIAGDKSSESLLNAINQHEKELKAEGISKEHAYKTIQSAHSLSALEKDPKKLIGAMPRQAIEDLSVMNQIMGGGEFKGSPLEKIVGDLSSKDPETQRKMRDDIIKTQQANDQVLAQQTQPSKPYYGLFQTPEQKTEASRAMVLGQTSFAESADIFARKDLLKQSQGLDTEGLKTLFDKAKSQEMTPENAQIVRAAQIYSEQLKELVAATKTHDKSLNNLIISQRDYDNAMKADSGKTAAQQEELRRKLEENTETVARETRALEKAGGIKAGGDLVGGGGGKGGDGESIGEMFGKFAGIFTKAAAAVGGGIAAAKTMEVAARQEVIGKERGMWEARMSTEGLLGRQFMESIDVTKPENMLKYRGDVLFPGRNQFLGDSGRLRAEAIANREIADRMGLSQALKEKSGWNLGFGVAAGVGQMGVGASAGGPMGAFAAAQGGQQALNAVKDYYQEQATNDMNQLQGGISGSWLGKMVWGENESKRRARTNAQQKYEEFLYQRNQEVENLRQREVESDVMGRTALKQMQQQVQVQQQGVMLVGTAAKTRTDIINELYGKDKTGFDSELYKFRKGFANLGFGSSSLYEVRNEDQIRSLDEQIQTQSDDLGRKKDALTEAKSGRGGRGQAIRAVGMVGSQDYVSDAQREVNIASEQLQKTQLQRRFLQSEIDIANPLMSKNAPLLDSPIMSKANQVTTDLNAEMVKQSLAYEVAKQSAPTSRENYANKVAMTIPEFQAQSNMLSNVLGRNTVFGQDLPRGQASAKQTADFVELSRSGLGDMNSLLNNMSAINQVSGGQNNIEQLKNVLGAAVRAGFDGSRVGQQFVQTSISIADSLRLSRVDVASANLTDSMKWISTQGRGDERAMRLAAEGVKSFESFASQQTGIIGATRMHSMLTAGATVGQAMLMQDLGPAAISEMKADFAKLEKSGGNFNIRDTSWTKNIVTAQLFQAEKGLQRQRYIESQRGKMAPEAAYAKFEELAARNDEMVKGAVENPEISSSGILAATKAKAMSSADAVTRYAAGLYSAATGKDFAEQLDIANKQTGSYRGKNRKSTALSELAGEVTSGFRLTGMTQEAAYTATAQTMLEAGVGKAEVAQSVSKQRIDAANKKFIDPATKKLNEAINEVTARATPSGGAGKLKASEYLGYIAEGNLAGQTVGGEIITQEKAKRLQAEATRKDKDPAYKGTEEFQAVEKELQTKDRYSVAREMQSMVGEDVQKVEVKNFDQIGKAVSQYLNENKQMVFNRNGG